MSDILDDITFEDIQNNSKVDEQIDETKTFTRDSSYHIIQTFCSFKRRRDVLLFALVRFGEYQRYDIRVWYDNESKPGKGISFTEEEIKKLYDGLQLFDFDDTDYEERASYRSSKINASIFNQICLFGTYNIKNVTWVKEASIVDFGYGKKLDLRKWSEDYSICGKGISITFDEAESILESMKKLF